MLKKSFKIKLPSLAWMKTHSKSLYNRISNHHRSHFACESKENKENISRVSSPHRIPPCTRASTKYLTLTHITSQTLFYCSRCQKSSHSPNPFSSYIFFYSSYLHISFQCVCHLKKELRRKFNPCLRAYTQTHI